MWLGVDAARKAAKESCDDLPPGSWDEQAVENQASAAGHFDLHWLHCSRPDGFVFDFFQPAVGYWFKLQLVSQW